MKSEALAAKATVDDDESRVEDGEQYERQNEHEDVVERVEVDELVGEAVAQFGASQVVDRFTPVVDLLADQRRFHPTRNVVDEREQSHSRNTCTRQ